MKQLSIFYTLYLTLALCYSVNRIVALPQLHRYFNSLKNNKNFSFLLLFNIVIAFIVKFVSLLSVLFGVALCFSDIPKYKFPFFFYEKTIKICWRWRRKCASLYRRRRTSFGWKMLRLHSGKLELQHKHKRHQPRITAKCKLGIFKICKTFVAESE